MAPPITWRNIAAPNVGAELFALDRAGNSLGRSIRGIGENVQDFANDEQKRQTDDFISELNALGSDEQRNELVQNANRAFLDMNRVNQGVTAAQNQDFAVAEEARADTLFEDTLATNAQSREIKEEQLQQDIRTNPLELQQFKDQINRAESVEDRAVEQFDQQTKAFDNRQILFDQSQADKLANLPLDAQQRINNLAQANEVADGRVAKTALNEAIKSLDSMLAGSERDTFQNEIREYLSTNTNLTTSQLNAALSTFRDANLDATEITPEQYGLDPLSLKIQGATLASFGSYELALTKAVALENARATPGAVAKKVNDIISKNSNYVTAKQEAVFLQKSKDLTDAVDVQTQSKMAQNVSNIEVAVENKGEVSTIVDLLRRDHSASYPTGVIAQGTLLNSVKSTLDNVYSAYSKQLKLSNGETNIEAKAALAHATYKAYASMAANSTFFWGANSEVIGLSNTDGIFYDSDISGYKGNELRKIMSSFLPDYLKDPRDITDTSIQEALGALAGGG